MDIAIDEEILERATLCPYRHGCLSDTSPLCKVYLVNGESLYVDFQSKDPCPYSHRVASSTSTCSCPVRIEIFKRQAV